MELLSSLLGRRGWMEEMSAGNFPFFEALFFSLDT